MTLKPLRTFAAPAALSAALLLAGPGLVWGQNPQQGYAQNTGEAISYFERQDTRQQQQRQISGEVIRAKDVRIRTQAAGDRDIRNRVVLVRSKNGQRFVVDLGSNQKLRDLDLSEGTQIDVRGQVARISDRPVLIADQATIDGQQVSIDRPDRQQLNQVAGDIVRSKQVRIGDTDLSSQVVMLRTEQGRNVIVDLGPSRNLSAIDLTEGKQLSVQGEPARVGDHLVIMADSVTANGQTIPIGEQRRMIEEEFAKFQEQEQGQNQGQAQQAQSDQSMQTPGFIQVTSASEIVGRSVTEQSGQDAGQIEFVLVDHASGDVRFAIIGSSPGYDLGRELVAVPWSALRVPIQKSQPVRLNTTLDRLQQAPRISLQRIAELIQPRVMTQVYDYYLTPGERQAQNQQRNQQGQGQGQQQNQQGQNQQNQQNQQAQNQQGQDQQQNQQGMPHILVGREYVTMLAPPELVSADAIRGIMVQASDGRPVGDVDQVMIDTTNGHVAYVLLARGGYLGANRQWVPVPFKALQWSQGQGLTIDMANVAEKRFPVLPQQASLPVRVRGSHLQRLYDQFGVTPYWQQASQDQSQNQGQQQQNRMQQQGQQNRSQG